MNNNENNLQPTPTPINQPEVTTKPKSSKVPIIIIIIVLLVAIGCGIWFITKGQKNESGDTTTTTTNKPVNKDYKLVKLGDFNHTITQILDIYDYNGYTVFDTFNRLGSQSYSVYKDNKLIKSFDEDNYGSIHESNEVRYFAVYDDKDEYTYANIDLNTFEPSSIQYKEFEVINQNMIVVRKDKKYAIVDTNDKEIIKFGEYDAISASYYNIVNPVKYAFVYKNNKVGVVNEKGELVIPLQYDRKKEYDEMMGESYYSYGVVNNDYPGKILFIVNKGKQKVVLNESGKELFNYDGVIYLTKNYIYNALDKTIKKYDYEGKVLNTIDMKNRELISIGDEGNIVYKENKSFYLLDVNNKIKNLGNVYYNILEDPEDDSEYLDLWLSDTIRVIKENNKFKIIANKNDEVLGTYDNLRKVVVSNGDKSRAFFIVTNNNKSGLIDAITGSILIPLEYDLVPISSDEEADEEEEEEEEDETDYDDGMYSVFKKGNIYYGVDYNGEIRKIETEKDGAHDYMYFFSKAMLVDYNLYNYNLEKIYDKEASSWEEDNGLLMITSSNGEDKKQSDYETVVFDGDKLLKYENKDDAKLYMYAGYLNDKVYFITDKGIYYLTNK